MHFKYTAGKPHGAPKDTAGLTCLEFKSYDPDGNLLYEGNTWGACIAKGMRWIRDNPARGAKKKDPEMIHLWAKSRKTGEWWEVCQLYGKL